MKEDENDTGDGGKEQGKMMLTKKTMKMRLKVREKRAMNLTSADLVDNEEDR